MNCLTKALDSDVLAMFMRGDLQKSLNNQQVNLGSLQAVGEGVGQNGAIRKLMHQWDLFAQP